MSRIPNFTRIGFTSSSVDGCSGQDWATPEGLHVKCAYGPEDMKGIDFLNTWPGIAPFLRGPYPTMYTTQAMDHPAICRLLHGGGFQRLLPPQPGGGADGPVHRLRPRHPSRLRLGPSARCGRRRHGGRGDRFDLRHAHAVRRHPARPDDGVDDHERRGAAHHGALHRGGRGTGRSAGEACRDDPERHPEGVHGPQHLHLSAAGVDEDRVRHLQVHVRADAEVQLHLDLRLSHAGGGCDGGSRAGLYAGGRPRICEGRRGRRAAHRQVRATAFLLLGHRHELLHGSGQDARGPHDLGQAHQALRAEGRALPQPAHPLPDERLEPCRTGRVQQRDAHLHRGDGGNAGRHAVAPHQFAGRGAGAAHRFLRPHRAQHAALPAAGGGNDAA